MVELDEVAETDHVQQPNTHVAAMNESSRTECLNPCLHHANPLRSGPVDFHANAKMSKCDALASAADDLGNNASTTKESERSCWHDEIDYDRVDYWTNVFQLYHDDILLKTYTLYQKWGAQNKFWLIMLTGSAMLYEHRISKRYLKYVASHVTSISSSAMTRTGKSTMKKALREYEKSNGDVDLQNIFPDLEPFMAIVQDYDALMENG